MSSRIDLPNESEQFDPMVSVVVPAHNESTVVTAAIDEITRALDSCVRTWEIIVVDDGSTDGTFDRVREIIDPARSVRAIRLSRNFGKESAILAGLQSASGRAVITIDADLQHPPQLIPQLIREWKGGAKVVNAVKRSRPTDGRIATARAAVFNAVFTFLGGVSLEDASDFKLLDRVVVDALVDHLPERARFYRGLAKWVGYQQANVPFDVAPRAAGTTNWSTMELIRLALSALVSFTALPLRIVVGLGAVTLILGFVIGADALLSWSRGEAVSGFATLITTMLITGSFIMISLGIIGEYIGRIFEESKRRPLYLVESRVGFEKPDPTADPTEPASISISDLRL